jgi:two-component system, NarL family, response regulator
MLWHKCNFISRENLMNEDKAIRVAIVDDHSVVRMGLKALIESEQDMCVVAEAANGIQAFEIYKAHEPDVMLIDQRLPGMDGVEALIQIRTQYSDARIIIITTYDTEEDIHKALRAGVMGYLLKDALNNEIVEAIREIYRGNKYMSPGVAIRAAESINRPTLSPREVSVLKLLAVGMTNKEIAKELDISESTTRTHVEHILSKLKVDDRTLAVTTALQRGIIRLT